MRRLLLALGLLVVSLAPSASAAGGEIPGWTPVSCSCGHALSLDQVDTDRAYLGTDAGVNRTDDGGWTWKPLAFPVSGEVRRVSFADRDNGAVVGGFEGVVVTRDGGTSWTQYRPWTGRSYDIVALPEVWYGLAESGLYASTDRGRVWKKVHDVFLPLTTFQRMAWSDKDTGVVANAAYAFTTSDGGRTWTSAATSSLFAFDALSLSSGEAAVGGERSVHSGRPWVGHVEASRHAPYAFADRGVSDEQVHGLARSGSTLYAVGVEGLLARSTDAGRTWTYETTPPSYERSTFYDVDTLDDEHAMVAVYSGRVLLRQAPTVHDVTTAPHRGLGLGLGLLGLAGAGAGTWALVTKKPKVVVGALAGVTLAAGVPGALLALDSRTCHPSGCDEVTAAASDEDGFVTPPSPTPSATSSPTPSPTPSATPSPTASPTPSPTASPTPSPTSSPTPLGAFTASLTTNPSCDENGEAHPGTITVKNTTVAPVLWSAAAREQVYDNQQNQVPWAALTPTQGTLAPGATTTISVLPDNSLCVPGNGPTTQHVDLQPGAKEIPVTVNPQG